MAPDATTEKIRDKNKSRFNSRQAVMSIHSISIIIIITIVSEMGYSL